MEHQRSYVCVTVRFAEDGGPFGITVFEIVGVKEWIWIVSALLCRIPTDVTVFCING